MEIDFGFEGSGEWREKEKCALRRGVKNEERGDEFGERETGGENDETAIGIF